MIAQVVGTFLFAVIVNVVSVAEAILVGLAFATFIKANGLFSQKSTYAIMVEAGYILVMTLVLIGVNQVL